MSAHIWETTYGPGHECSYLDCYCDHVICTLCGVEQDSNEDTGFCLEKNMKASDVEVGTSVKNTSGYPKGTIIGTKLSDGDQIVAVEWSDGSLTKENINDLQIIDSELERDYEEIKSKIMEAANLLNGASSLASKHKTDISSLQYNDEDVDFGIEELFGALRNAGWSTSSMRC